MTAGVVQRRGADLALRVHLRLPAQEHLAGPAAVRGLRGEVQGVLQADGMTVAWPGPIVFPRGGVMRVCFRRDSQLWKKGSFVTESAERACSSLQISYPTGAPGCTNFGCTSFGCACVFGNAIL